MPSWWESVGNTVKGLYCNVAEFGEWYAGGVATLLDETKLDELAEFQLEYAQWANRKFCGKKPSSSIPPYLIPPYVGGQCPVQYNWQCSFSFTTSGGAIGNRNFFRQIDGPTSSSLAAGYQQVSSTQWAIKSGDGFIWGGEQYPLSSTFNGISFFAAVGWRNIGSTGAFQPMSTLTGDCASKSLSPSIPPNPNPLVLTRDVEYEDEDGITQTDEDVVFTLGTPVLEDDGSISVPYEVCKDDFCVRGKLNIGDDLRLDDKYPSDTLLPPEVQLDAPVGDGVLTPESELDGEPLSEADKEKTPILGVFIKSQKAGSKRAATEIFMNDDAPAILAPNIGFVRFRILYGDESGWLADIPIKSVNAYIPVPDKMEAVSCEVAWQAGWEGKFILQRGVACCKECEEKDD